MGVVIKMSKNINQDKLKKIGDNGVLAMICDSTNVFSIGRAGSEADVRKNMLNIIYTFFIWFC